MNSINLTDTVGANGQFENRSTQPRAVRSAELIAAADT